MIKFSKHSGIIVAMIFAVVPIMAQAVIKRVDGVTIEYEVLADNGIRLQRVDNNTGADIVLLMDSKSLNVGAGESKQPFQYVRNRISFSNAGKGGGTSRRLWKREQPEAKNVSGSTTSAAGSEANEISSVKENNLNAKAARKEKSVVAQDLEIAFADPVAATSESLIDKINNAPFFGEEEVRNYVSRVDLYKKGIDNASDKSQYIKDHDIRRFLEDSRLELEEKAAKIDAISKSVVESSASGKIDSSTASLITETLNNRLMTRKAAYEALDRQVQQIDGETADASDDTSLPLLIIILLCLCVAGVAFFIYRRISKKKSKQNVQAASPYVVQNHDPDKPDIVVRRRTTSILKKQCIDDVIGNPEYMLIESADFVQDSAVRRIYVKNSCIKEVYNLYAEDLRNTSNPKEDGCMVLGRWVQSPDDKTYDVTLEEVVFPGDDAIFKEYELNFGGKIKLRVAEKLRKLRHDTNLQYDLVCWIHSHPGLGVFFSNSDVNVQQQLKHAQHPKFLVAFVVDILTSNQELGIFTYRNDGTMNSKADLLQMHSLEDFYKWALQSDTRNYSNENYFNVVKNAEIRLPSCHGVELNNSAIIDLTQIVVGSETGIVGWAIGTSMETSNGVEYVVSGIVKESDKPTAGVVECLISEAHMSLPTIQRLIADNGVNVAFVMVYSSRQMSLTTLPVVNGQLLAEEKFYGDVNIEDLKIWTRRKR